MKKFLILLAILLAGIVLFWLFRSPAAEQDNPSVSQNKNEAATPIDINEEINPENPTVATTIFPIYDITARIAGEDTNVLLLLPPGTSPHLYEPSPVLIQKAYDTDIVLAIGHGLDSWADNVVKQLPTAQKIVLDMQLSLREHEEHEEGHDDDDPDHTGADPHYWLNPENAITMINVIANYLGANDPENFPAYNERAQALKKEIREHNEQWKQQLANLEQKEFITFHDAFGYFADYYGLEVVATIEPFAGKEPTAQYLQKVIGLIEEHNISRLYLEPQLSSTALETFAKDNNLALGVLDPIGGVVGRGSYIELMNYNVQTLLETQQ